MSASPLSITTTQAQPPAMALSLFRGLIPIKPTGRMIIAEVAERYGLTPGDLCGPSRRRPVAIARQHAMWEMRQRTALSLPLIGQLLGGRDHTTALHGIRKHERRRTEAAEAEV